MPVSLHRFVVKDGARFGFAGEVFMTETQKTRTGNDGEGEKTRPYRYGEFDVLAGSDDAKRVLDG